MSRGDQLGRVVAMQAGEGGVIGELDAVLVLAEHVRLVGVEAGEVVAAQRHRPDAIGPENLDDWSGRHPPGLS